MKADTETTVNYILDDEGPEFNAGGSEPGGGSKFGISMTVLLEVTPKALLSDLARLTRDGAAQIYVTHIMPTIRFDELPPGVDYRLMDIRTNLGLTGSLQLLELVMQRWPLTGRMSDGLMQGVLAWGEPKFLVYALSAAWVSKKHESPNWNPSPITKTGYGHGWSNRNIRATSRALGMVHE